MLHGGSGSITTGTRWQWFYKDKLQHSGSGSIMQMLHGGSGVEMVQQQQWCYSYKVADGLELEMCYKLQSVNYLNRYGIRIGISAFTTF